MPDVLSGLAIQGTLTNQSLKSVNQGMSSLKKNQILQDIQMVSMGIKTRYFGNYQGVNKNSVSLSVFNGIDYNIGSNNNSTFFIELYDLNKDICQYLMSSGLPTISVSINGNNSKNACVDNNKIKLIFD